MGQRPQPRLRLASAGTKARIWEMLQRCLTELAKITGSPAERDTGGQTTYPSFDLCWQEPDRYPFGIWFGSSLAGLCLVRRLDTGRYQVTEFYVEPTFRRRGIGRTAVEQTAAWCACPWPE